MKYAASFERQAAMYSVFEQGQRYCVRYLHRYDFTRQNAYQRLRADIFVKQAGWELSVDKRNREHDRYDEMDENRIQIACVYRRYGYKEYLLGGVRIHTLETWDDSMVVNEFHSIGMIPTSIVSLLKERYSPTDFLEISRLCLRRGKTDEIVDRVSKIPSFRPEVTRDLIYAAMFAQVEKVGRRQLLFIADRYYLQVLRRSHFVLEELYFHPQEGKRGYSLAVLDFLASLTALENVGAYDQVRRILSLRT
jgi:N-acyl-L-homoserine lactone synthetase